MTIPEKYSPYIFIAILALMMAIFRSTILTEFPWYIHVLGFVGQFIIMCAIWQLIIFINKKLQKRFPFEKYPGKQIMLQVIVTIVLLSPVVFIPYYLLSPYLPKFIDRRFTTLLTVILILALMLMIFGYYTYDLFLKHKKSTEEKVKLELAAT